MPDMLVRRRVVKGGREEIITLLAPFTGARYDEFGELKYCEQGEWRTERTAPAADVIHEGRGIAGDEIRYTAYAWISYRRVRAEFFEP